VARLEVRPRPGHGAGGGPVARTLLGLPQIEAAFAAGELSYSKVRALCRAATERNETELLALCSHHHRLVHEGRFAIQRNAERAYYFTRPDERPLDQAQVPKRDRVEEERPVYRV
jgi:hypothetical protein